jgi:hypothetical protein
LVERNNGIFGGCWCMGFHPEGVGKDTTAELNRDRKLARVRAGTAHAALVFHGDDCLGWCQFGTPGELPRIKNRAADAVVIVDPAEYQRRPGEPERPLRTLPFGQAGLVTFLVCEPDDLVLVTRVIWTG